MRLTITLSLLFFAFSVSAQTFTFECMDSTRLTGVNCDVCPVTNITSRSFCGLMVYKNGLPHKWIDQPYTVRRKPGNSVEFLEQIPSIPSIQTQDRITISLAQTAFFTVTGMIDSTVCHCATGVVDTLPLFYASDSLDFAPIFKGDTLTIVGRDLAHVSFDSLLQKYVIQVDSITGGSGTVTSFSSGNLSPLFTTSVATATTTPALSFAQINQSANTVFSGPTSGGAAAPTFRALVLADILGLNTANNGLSDNEAGGIFRLGNRYMNSSDGPFGTDRKVNVNAFMGFFGDNSDSTLLTIDGTNDRIGIGMLPTNRLDVSGASGTYIRVGTSGAVANAGLILNNSADVADTWAVYRQGDGDFAIGASDDNEWPSGTLTDPFIIKPSPPSNSFYMDATGFIALAGTTAARRLDNYGETRLRDLTTDTPTGIVGHDADGDLGTITVGSGLSLSGGSLTSTAGTFYQTMRDNGSAETQQPALNFISSSTVSALLTNDGANSETEVTFAIPNNAISNALIRQGVARSVIGVTGNATANVADIQGTTDQVLRVNTAGTGLGFGQIATGGITDDAVTYAKIQNVAADDVFLGRISGAGGNVEELTAANAWTILGITGTANRFAIFPTATTISTNAAFSFTTSPDRVTFAGSAAGVGANNAFLNLNSGAITGATEFLRMSGNINGNMLATMINSNTASTNNHTIFQIASGGSGAGSAVMQFTVNGLMTHAVGIDNVDDRFKITPNNSIPGGTALGITVWEDGGGVGCVGIDNAFPVHPLTVEGRARADLFLGEGNLYSSGNINFGNGAGTSPTLTQIVGTGNSVMVRFSTGTVPTASGTIFTITYPTAFLTASMVNFSAGCNNASAVAGDNAATDLLKFKILTSDATTFVFKAVGTLAASTAYALTFNVFGY